MTRAVSTPLDASLAILLVTAAAAILVGVSPPVDPAPSPHRVAEAVLPITANVTCTGRRGRIHAPLGGLLASAASDRTPPACASRATERALTTVVPPTNLTVATHGGRVLTAGPTPRGPRVRAAVLPIPGTANASVVVRTWSP